MIFDTAAYQSRMDALFRRFQSVQTAGFVSGAYKPGLEGMKALDEALGHPWKRYDCIHVAGTNGKGSVCSMLAAALSSGECRVGLYTSPHLLDFRERIKVVSGDGFRCIPREDVWDFLELYESTFEGLSFFEITTGMAFWWFARQGVDCAVIETGLGGRLDSTNIITPVLSVITSIGLDHCALLGGTRAEIAAEKAGIFKPGVPALVASRDCGTGPVFVTAAAAAGAPLSFASDRLPISTGQDCSEEELLSRMDLAGPCQDRNLHTTLVALDLIKGAGRPVPEPARLEAAGRLTGLRGRWERLSASPEVICDIAHNPPALKENFAWLEAEASRGRDLIVVYGIMADKDLGGIVPVMPGCARWILAAPDSPRALPAGKLQEAILQLRPKLQTTVAGSVPDAVSQAISMARDLDNPLIYIGGSTFVVAEAIPCFTQKGSE